MDDVPKEKLMQWEKDVVMPLAAELAEMSEELRSKELQDFNEAVVLLCRRAIDALEPEYREMPHFNFLLASLFNSVLPLDYPYIVAFAFSDAEPGVYLSVVDRKSLPGAHDFTSRNLVPLLHIKSRKPLKEQSKMRVITTDARFVNDPDGLEELFKK